MPSSITSKKKDRLRSIEDVREAGLLSNDADSEDAYARLERQYDIGVTDHVVGQIQDLPSLKNDPVGRQYIPSLEELTVKNDEESDPISDGIYTPVRGIVHRYPDRVLLKISNVCAVYCRYCFRREMIGAGSEHLNDDDFEAAIDYIKAHKEVWEVILTGGDPLILSARRLQKIMEALEAIEHVKIIRIHTRIPVVYPDKIDDTILSVLKTISKAVYIVVHVNHVQEISESVESKILALFRANCSILSQSVLLKGVNDNVDALEKLFKNLVCIHVKPYYLHHLDRAKGTSHFRVSIKRGQEIMADLQGRVSGICLPKYMLDIPGGHGKIPVTQGYITGLDHNTYRVEDYQGCEHLYFDEEVENVS